MADMDQIEALLKAAEHGDVNFLSSLLDKGFDINEKHMNYDGLLLIAYRNGHKDFVYKLLEAGLDTDSIIIEDLPRSHKWQTFCLPHVIWFKVYRESLKRYCGKQYKLIFEASFKNDFPAISKFLRQSKSCWKHGAKYEELYSILLFLFVYSLDCPSELLQMLIDMGANVNSRFHGFRMSDFAVLCDNTIGLDVLLKNDCVIDDEEDSDSFSSFRHAVILSKVHCLDLLLCNSNLNTSNIWKENGAKLLTLAVRCGNDRIVDLLLKYGACVERTEPKELHNFPLIHACKSWNLPSLDLLLKHGANVNNRNEMGETPLIHAAISGLKSCMEKLISYNADINAVDCDRQTALMHAIQRQHKDCVCTLISAGADTSIVNCSNETALINAISLHDAEILELLLLSDLKHSLTGSLQINQFHHDAFSLALRQFDVRSLLTLLKFGVFSWEWLDRIKLKEILRTEILARVLVVSNIPPSHFHVLNNVKGPKTLFQSALAFQDIWTAYYLVANLYLDEYDFQYLQREKRFIHRLHCHKNPSHALLLLNALTSHPIPLQVVCILKLSKIIDSCQRNGKTKRREMINCLPIPEKFKKVLNFQGPYSNLCVDHWKSLGTQMSQRGCNNMLLTSLRPASSISTTSACQADQCGDNDRGFRLRYDLLQAINKR